MSIAKHYETGESLPEEVYFKLLTARTFRAGSLSLRQVSNVLGIVSLFYGPCFCLVYFRFYYMDNIVCLFFLVICLVHFIVFFPAQVFIFTMLPLFCMCNFAHVFIFMRSSSLSIILFLN